MGHFSHRDSPATTVSTSSTCKTDLDVDIDVEWPFGKVQVADWDDLRETAYEVFFTACRSTPGFGGRNPLSCQPSSAAVQDSGEGSPTASGGSGNARNGLGLVAHSKTKRNLGLKMSSPRKPTTPKRMLSNSNSGSGSGPGSPLARQKRPITTAQLMRQQMRVSEQTDIRLRKTLMRTLVGQMGRKAETIILPLELLRHLKPSEFSDPNEYHQWQKQQLRILEAGLLLYPSVPLDRSDPSAMRLLEIIRSSEVKPIDTGKGSETMKALCNCVVTLAWRNTDGAASDACHWADGYPINLHLYVLLLQAIFDLHDDTLVVDEVDELTELMKKTWPTLGINKLVHNICFTWVLFQQFVKTGKSEIDLLNASMAMLAEVENDAKRADREFIYVKILSSVLAMMQAWAEKRLFDYHDSFRKGNAGMMEIILPLALSSAKILWEDVTIDAGVSQQNDQVIFDSKEKRVAHYIRSSMKNCFTKILENGIVNSLIIEVDEDASTAIIQLAKDTADLAMKEKEIFSPILKKWHTNPAGVAAVTLHNCFGFVLKQYLDGLLVMTKDANPVLQAAGKLEKFLFHMTVDDSGDFEDGGKPMIREIVPYEVESVTLRLMKKWVADRLKRGNEAFVRAKETETWNQKSKSEPNAESAVEMMNMVKDTVDSFFNIPLPPICDDLINDLADGLEILFNNYICFLAACGSKQSYLPALPPLTRCNQRSKILKLWQRTTPCRAQENNSGDPSTIYGHHPRPSMSRGTQRLFVRLNTLYYILSHIQSLEKTFSISPHSTPPPQVNYHSNYRRFPDPASFFELTRTSIQSAIQHVAEVAAHRLTFLDSQTVFYESLYVVDTANARIRPALKTLKQNLTFLGTIVSDRAQPMAVKEVMKASFEAFLMVLLAGGSLRAFTRSDYDIVVEDFGSLKRMFCVCGAGLVLEEVVEREAKVVEGVIVLMGQPTTQLVEEFSIAACESSGIGLTGGTGNKVPMPPTTGRWNRLDPNTILRVLCHRNDSTASNFLKRTFQLPKRT